MMKKILLLLCAILPYADFRVRPYSLEMTLDNICKYYDWNWWKQSGNLYKIKLYEYPRRHEQEGKMMLDWLSSLYSNKEQVCHFTLSLDINSSLNI